MEDQDWFAPLGFIDTFKRTFAVYRDGFAAFIKINLVVLVPIAIFRIILALFLAPLVTDIDFEDPTWILKKNVWIPFVVVMLVESIGSLIMGGAYPRVIGSIYVRHEPDWIGSIKLALKRLCPMFLAYILYLVAVFIGTLLFYIPGIIVLLSGFMFREAIMIENSTAVASLGRSWNLSKGKRCFILCCIMTVMVFVVALNFLLFGPSMAGQTFTTWGIIVQTVLSIFIAPISAGIVTVMYLGFRVQDEGLTMSQLENELSRGGASVDNEVEYTSVSSMV